MGLCSELICGDVVERVLRGILEFKSWELVV